MRLRKLSCLDRSALADICNRIDRTYLSERIPYPYTDDHAAYFIDMANKEEEEGHGIFRGIEVDGRLVGVISAEGKQDVYSRDAEVGYYLDPEYQGKGIMAEALKELSSICFDSGYECLVAKACLPNVASIKTLLKAGFGYVGTIKGYVVKAGRRMDICLFSLNKASLEY